MTYCYSFGEMVLEFDAPFGKPPKALYVSGMIFERDKRAEIAPRERADAWVNHESVAMGCHPDDRELFMRDAKEKGVPTYFNERGNPEFRSKAHWDKYRRACGFVDKQGYC